MMSLMYEGDSKVKTMVIAEVGNNQALETLRLPR